MMYVEEPVTLLLTRLTSLTIIQAAASQGWGAGCHFCFVKWFCDTWRQTVFFSGATKSSAVPVSDRGWKCVPSYTLASAFGVAPLRLEGLLSLKPSRNHELGNWKGQEDFIDNEYHSFHPIRSSTIAVLAGWPGNHLKLPGDKAELPTRDIVGGYGGILLSGLYLQDCLAWSSFGFLVLWGFVCGFLGFGGVFSPLFEVDK